MDKPEKETILVVEDRSHNLKLLFELFTGEGFRVLSACTGETAIEIVKKSLPNLIILDAMLPGIDGFETCIRLKQNPVYAEIPIIFMTGLNSIEHKLKGFEVGGVDYITKPFQLDEMVIRVKSHLKIQKLQHKLEEKNQKLQIEIQQRQIIEATLRKTQSNLEQKVEERTAQLKATNALLEQKVIDLQETEIILQKALQSAELAAQTKNDFLAKMSHELRTPLNAILGFTQLLDLDITLSPSGRKKLKIIHENSEHLLNLINNILSIAQIDNSQEILQESCFDLHDFLTTIVNLFHPKARQKQLLLKIELTENIPQLIQTDERKLRQVLINLLDNAIAFTEEGYVCLQISPVPPEDLPPRNGKKLKLSFTVEDTGQGISQEKLAYLFEPSTQIENSQFSSKGIGLGLFICQEFVRLLGGELRVDSLLNSGSKFSFEIPVYFDSPKIIDSEKAQQKKRIFPLEPIQYRLLIADRMSENCQSLLEILKPLGFNVEIASDREECLALWHCWQPHIILLDLHLPQLDKREFLAQIDATETRHKTIAIALTASASQTEWEEAIAIGCQDFISKPFREEVVLEKLAHHLSLLSRDRATISLEHSELVLEDLTREELAIMPGQWLNQFSDATRKINESKLRKLLNEIPETENKLRQKITHLLDNFRFDILNQLID